MITIPTTRKGFAMPVFHAGDTVTYMGHAAVVAHGNEPDPEWTGHDQPGGTVNIRFTPAVRSMSPQIDVYASSVLPA